MKLRLSNIRKRYTGEIIGVDGIDLSVDDGQMAVFLGPSGCGKTTLLRLICGLEAPDEGSIHLEDKEITDWEPKRRDIAMVFQNYALYPHMTVRGNLEFGLKSRKIPKEQFKETVDWAADLLGLSELLNRRPKELSGGQRQRVALGRAIVRRPKLYLYDEPLSNLDAELRMRMRGEILALHRRVKATSIYVTHDQVEAMSLADVIFIMKEGKISASGTPEHLYSDPPNLFTAGFLGIPPMNLIEGSIENGYFLSGGGMRIELPENLSRDSNKIVLGLRPEEIEINSEPGISFEVISLENLGAGFSLFLKSPSGDILRALSGKRHRIGETLKLDMTKARKYAFDGSSGRRI